MDADPGNDDMNLTPPPIDPFSGLVDENGEYVYGSRSMSQGKQSALMQDSIIPKGWKPTVSQPIPVTRCTSTVRNGDRKGERCGRWAITGATVCIVHGGRLPTVKKAAEDRILAAKMRLVDSTDDAIDTLIDLLTSGGDQVKLGAAREILDRAGVKSSTEIEVNVTTAIKPSEIIQEKLRTIAERAEEQRELKAEKQRLQDLQDSKEAADDSDDSSPIIQGEVIPD